jgi:hypothetical protein
MSNLDFTYWIECGENTIKEYMEPKNIIH